MVSNNATVMFEGAQMIFRNFAGKEGMYNREGDRNFCLVLEPDLAEQMIRDGWNVKFLRPRDADAEPTPYIQVSIGWKVRPPTLVMISWNPKTKDWARTNLDEDSIEIFDWVDIKNVDCIIRPYTWEVGGRSGTKAYLKSLFLTVETDPLEMKYADIEQLPARAGQLELPAGVDPNIWEGEVVDEKVDDDG